jgi:hypothetical protein
MWIPREFVKLHCSELCVFVKVSLFPLYPLHPPFKVEDYSWCRSRCKGGVNAHSLYIPSSVRYEQKYLFLSRVLRMPEEWTLLRTSLHHNLTSPCYWLLIYSQLFMHNLYEFHLSFSFSNGSYAMTLKSKAASNLFLHSKEHYLNKNCIFLKYILPYIISVP